MGNSHFKSNFIGFAGTEYIASVAAIKNLGGLSVTSMDVTTATITTVKATTANVTTASANMLKATGLGDSSYIKMGGQQYMFWGNSNTDASVLAEATALVATPLKGSMYASRKGQLWFFKTDAIASPVGVMD